MSVGYALPTVGSTRKALRYSLDIREGVTYNG